MTRIKTLRFALTLGVAALSLLATYSFVFAANRPDVASPGPDSQTTESQIATGEAARMSELLDAVSAATAFQAGGDRLDALQNNDGGWDWPLDDGNPNNASPLNTLGPIAMGLAQAYYNTGDPDHLAAMSNAGGLLLTKTNNFSPSDGYLAAELDKFFGGTTYTTHVLTYFYGPLAAGTYDRNGLGTLYDTAGYVNLIRTTRANQGIPNLAAWDIGMGLVGAVAAGADPTAWIAGVKAEIDELDGANYYDVIGLAGAVYGLAAAGEDFDPTAGEHAAASSLADLAAILAGYQIAGGGFSWNSLYLTPGNETNQETSYAILALNEFNRDGYIDAIQGAGSYLLSVQLLTGGWENYTGNGENNEITAEALWALRIAFPEVWVNGATGSDSNDGSMAEPFATIQKGIDEVLSYGIVNVADGTYPQTLNIYKALALYGQSEAGTIIDTSAFTDYGIDAAGDYPFEFKNFSLIGPTTNPSSGYGLKVSGDDAEVVIENVTVQDSGRSGIDLNGIAAGTLTNLNVFDNGGVGLALSDASNVVITGIDTNGNAWGGIGLFTWGQHHTGGSDSITLQGTNSYGEDLALYVDLGNWANPLAPYPLTNFVQSDFFYIDATPADPTYTGYHTTQTKALTTALVLKGLYSVEFYVREIATGDFYVTPGLLIQTAVDAADPGNNVYLLTGTFIEQVEIAKDINLEGLGSPSVIQSPATLTKSFATPGNTNKPVLYIHDTANASVRNLTVDGAGLGNSNYRFLGIGFRNAGGTVEDVDVLDIRDTPFSGTQHGTAIYLYNDDAVSRTINVWDSTITGFQKNAMALIAATGTPLVVDVSGNDITGAGATTVTAQNGIQVQGASVTGVVDGNSVADIAYDNTASVTKWAATSILNFYADLDITNNTITGAHLGIYHIDAHGRLNGNHLTIEKIGVYAYGIIATDPPGAVPAPFDAPGTGEGPAGYAPEAVLIVEANDNVVTFSGGDNTATYGIEADAGWGPDDVDFTANRNTVDGFEVGIEIYLGTDTSAVFTSVTATDNCLFDNTYGMRSNDPSITVNGEYNYWGDPTGPLHATNPGGLGDEVSDYIDFDPWVTTGCNNWYNVDQDATYVTLQAALDTAAPGDTIQPTANGVAGGGTVTTPDVTIDLNGLTAGPGSPFLTVAAANVSVVGPGVLDGNGSLDPAILVVSGGDNFQLENVEVREWADGVQVAANVTSIDIISNFIHSNTDAGLQVDSGFTIGGVQDIYGNLFKLNGGNGVQNDGAGTIEATYNSWGDLAGPFGTTSSYGGDGVSAGVLYDPWTFAEFYLDVLPVDGLQVTVTEDQPFDVEIKADAENVNGVIVRFEYDANLLTANSLTFNGPWADANTICIDSSAPGMIEFQCNLIFPTSQWDADGGPIATVNFTADGPGLTGNGPWQDILDIDHTVVQSVAIGGVKIFVNNAGFLDASVMPDRDITDANDGVIDILGSAQFTGFVNLEGRGDDGGATVSVYDPGLTQVADAASSSSGAYTTADLSPNYLSVGTTYYLYVDAPLFLPTNIAIDVSMETHDLDTRPLTVLNNVLLLGGDANNNNNIGIGDLSCIGAALGGSSTCGGVGNADVNGDGVVNFVDIALAAGNYDLDESPWIP